MGGVDPTSRGLALVNLTVQRAIAILLAQFRGLVLPVVRDPPFHRRLLFVGIALARRGDQARINDLARHGKVAGLPQRRIEALEQWSDCAGLRQLLPKQPNRAGVGNALRQTFIGFTTNSARRDMPSPRQLPAEASLRELGACRGGPHPLISSGDKHKYRRCST
jgi:hypothetical protein